MVLIILISIRLTRSSIFLGDERYESITDFKSILLVRYWATKSVIARLLWVARPEKLEKRAVISVGRIPEEAGRADGWAQRAGGVHKLSPPPTSRHNDKLVLESGESAAVKAHSRLTGERRPSGQRRWPRVTWSFTRSLTKLTPVFVSHRGALWCQKRV